MNKKLSVALVVTTAILSGGSLVFARGMNAGFMHRGFGGPKIEETAKVLGVTAADLSAQLKTGKTIEDVAKEKGVTPAQLKDAFQAQRLANEKTRFAQLVTSGKITQAQADAQLQWESDHNLWLQNHPAPLAGKGFERGFMMGGHGMGGMHLNDDDDDDSSNSKTP